MTTKFQTMPSLFIPHGGGPAFFMTGPMNKLFEPMKIFLQSIPNLLPTKPSAILLITAHWEALHFSLSGGEKPNLIYDYFGFPPETYKIQYPAPAPTSLALEIANLMESHKIKAVVEMEHGWDHGVFIPLKVIFPEAKIPVIALSLKKNLVAEDHIQLGFALQSLRKKNILIMGSGMSYHNLRYFGDAPKESLEFDQWLSQALNGNLNHRSSQLIHWEKAPYAQAAHPREEHLLPLMVASGAGSDLPAQKIWSGLVGKTVVSSWAFE